MKSKLRKKYYPWRNLVAALLTLALTWACIVLVSRSEYKLSPKAIQSSDLFRRYATQSPSYEENILALETFHSDFERTRAALYPTSFGTTNTPSVLQFGNGDIIGVHSGGRPRAPDGSGTKGSDTRRWFDAKFPLNQSRRLNFYGATGVGIGNNSEDEEAATELSREQLSVGGGFGFSYRLGENVELQFDYRHSRPLDSSSNYDPGNAAGFTVHLSF